MLDFEDAYFCPDLIYCILQLLRQYILLHFNASHLVLEILKHDKIRGKQFAIASSHFKFWRWTHTSFPPVRRKSGYRMCCCSSSGLMIRNVFYIFHKRWHSKNCIEEVIKSWRKVKGLTARIKFVTARITFLYFLLP